MVKTPHDILLEILNDTDITTVDDLRARLVEVDHRLMEKYSVPTREELAERIKSGVIPETTLVNEWLFLDSAIRSFEIDAKGIT